MPLNPAPRHAGPRTGQRGLSIIELLVGIVVALVVSAAAGAIFLANLSSTRLQLASHRLAHDLQAITELMAGELRRAGHWNAEAPGAPASNPYAQVHVAGECILFGYDRNLNGAAEGAELTGFKRLNGDLWMRTSGTSLTDCNDGSWERITNPLETNVISLAFNVSEKCLNANTGQVSSNGCSSLPAPGPNDRLVRTLTVTLSLTVSHKTFPDLTRSHTATAKLRNLLS